MFSKGGTSIQSSSLREFNLAKIDGLFLLFILLYGMAD